MADESQELAAEISSVEAPTFTIKSRTLPAEAAPYKWKPGQSGNPSGRPKRDLAAELCLQVFQKADFSKLAKQIVARMGQNPKMLQIVADRAFGKVPQTINLQGELNISTTVAERLKAARKRLGG